MKTSCLFCADQLPLHHFPSVCVYCLQSNNSMVTWFKAARGTGSTQGPFIIQTVYKCETPLGLQVAAASSDSRALLYGLSRRLKWKTSKTSRTSPVWWLLPGPTPPPNHSSSPNTTSASRRSAATTRPTCRMFCMLESVQFNKHILTDNKSGMKLLKMDAMMERLDHFYTLIERRMFYGVLCP